MLCHALDRPLILEEKQGAALLARTRDGEYRRPLKGDIKRFWEATENLAWLHFNDPSGSGRWANLAYVQADPINRYVSIGPPVWIRNWQRNGGKWTLTAEGGVSGKARIVAGEYGVTGRLITGIEYRLAAGYDGKPGVAPDLRPVSKGGPGPIVYLSWRNVLYYMGEVWNEEDKKEDHAASARFRQRVELLLKAGYHITVPGIQKEAEAGDSVEIIEIVRGSKSKTAGLRVRATRRFVEAARLANRKDGRGFETVSLLDWLKGPWT